MKRNIFLTVLCLFSVLFINISVSASEPPRDTELYAKSAVLMDADSGRVLYEKNGYAAMANASTTKILTCIVALENCEPDNIASVSSNAASQPKVRLGMQEGQKFYIRDLLYGLMLESYNDCAVVIAEHIAGTTEYFSELMNNKAKEIGCTDSYFITPNGLDAKNEESFHHTTAADLALIMRYCIKQSPKMEQFLEITRTAQYSFCDVDGTSSYTCYNHNAFLQMMDGALSGKTGFTGTAGYCYVGALEREGRTYIVALLACGWPNNKSYKWSDSKKLMTYGIEHFQKKSLDDMVLDESKLQPIAVEYGQSKRIGGDAWVTPMVGTPEGISELLAAEDEEIVVQYEITKKLQAPVEQWDNIGTITYLLNGEILRTCPVIAGNAVQKIDFIWCINQILSFI